MVRSVMMRRYIVLRKCPPALKDLEGNWFIVDSAIIGPTFSIDYRDGFAPPMPIQFGRTRRFETRDDGERAEVYELCEPQH